jgi:hypothetical protein
VTSPTPQLSPDSIREHRDRAEASVLDYLRANTRENGWTPALTFAGIAAASGLGQEAVTWAIARLLYRNAIDVAPAPPGGHWFRVAEVPKCRQAERD